MYNCILTRSSFCSKNALTSSDKNHFRFKPVCFRKIRDPVWRSLRRLAHKSKAD